MDYDGYESEDHKQSLLSILEFVELNRIRRITTRELEIDTTYTLGKGKQGVVKKGILDGKHLVAVKIIKDIDYKLLAHELIILSNIYHPNIAKFHGIVITNNVVELVFNYISGGSLSDYEFDKMKDETKIDFLLDIASAVECLHKNGFVHRDLNVDNIMIEEKTKKAFLIDFGIAKVVNTSYREKTRAKGNFYYLPPEVFIEDDIDSEKNILVRVTTGTDVWSLGCIASYLFSGYLPWTPKFKNSQGVIIACLMNGEAFPIPVNITSRSIFELIQAATQVSQKKRCTMSDIIKYLDNAKKELYLK